MFIRWGFNGRQRLVAHDQAAEVSKPDEEAHEFPPSSVAAQRSAILYVGFLTIAAVRRNYLQATYRRVLIQATRVVGEVSCEALRQVRYEARIEGRSDEATLVRRSRRGTDGERKTKAGCQHASCHELRAIAPLGRAHTPPPFFAAMNLSSMKHSERSNSPPALRSCVRASRMRSNRPARPVVTPTMGGLI
jgi:hypothetical protein